MIPTFALAAVTAVLAEVGMETRHPVAIAGRRWQWVLRFVQTGSFFVLALLVLGIVRSYA